MPIYMDVHIVPGVKARSVAEAHQMDIMYQKEYGCNCMTYWIDERRDSVFCLIEAPNKEAVADLHNKSHGLAPNKIIEVSPAVVESFLGRIYDPEDAQTSEENLKVFHDPSFRILLLTTTTDPVLLYHKMGAENASELLNKQQKIVRKNLAAFNGKEVEHGGTGFILSFASAGKAVACALAIQKEIDEKEAECTGFKMSINAGEPVAKSNKLFGDTIQMARHLCTVAKYLQVAMTSAVKDLVAKDLQDSNDQILTLPPQDEALLESLFSILETNWQNADFDIENYCQSMAMSKSQLYRKTIALTGMSPNILLKEYRLEKAKDLMKKQQYNIAQVTFDSGFTSPSYFTKCFKKKYGLLPNSYIEMLH